MPQPQIDPVTGKPIQSPPPGEGETVTITKEEWSRVNSSIQDLSQRVGQPPPAQAPAPQPIPDPSIQYNTEITRLDDAIDVLNGQIDEASQDQKPFSKILKERDKLVRARTRLEIQHNDLEPIRQAGFNAIDHLSGEVMKGSMPFLAIPDVRETYEQDLQTLTPEQKASPAFRTMIYERAVGHHNTKVRDFETEADQRRAAEADTQIPGGHKPGQKEGEVPPPEEVLSAGALASLKKKNMSADEFYRRRGHKEGWAGFYKKHYLAQEGGNA